MPPPNEVALKLKLDQIDADRGLSDMAKGFDKLKARANSFVQGLSGSLSGRAFTGAVRAAGRVIQQNLGSLLDPARPTILKSLDVQATAAGIAAENAPLVGGQVAGQAAQIAAQNRQQRTRFVVGAVQQRLQQTLALVPGAQIGPQDMKFLTDTFKRQAQEEFNQQRLVAGALDNAFPADQIQAMNKAAARDLRQRQQAQGESGFFKNVGRFFRGLFE